MILTAPFQAAHDALFKFVHGNNLIYNTCWEDPRIDRELMKLDESSTVVMITSAGCNALEYLLDQPAAVNAVDLNFRQNALLDLKTALILQGEHEDLFRLFGHGADPDFKTIYARVRPRLKHEQQAWWDKRIRYFAPNKKGKTFYFRGAAGQAAWMFRNFFFRMKRGVRDNVLELLNADSLPQQQEKYSFVEPRLWDSFSTWLVRQPWIMAMLGVPRPQIRLMQTQYPGGLSQYIQDKLKHVLTAVDIRDNYFWRVYLTGAYTSSCCPNYLKPENFLTLRNACPALRTHTDSISGFLRKNPGKYSHFVLLDHQDWLAWHAPHALDEEWRLILTNSRPGAKVLLRSAGLDLSFVPQWVRERVTFRPDLTDPLHPGDRVGTYGSLHFGIISNPLPPSGEIHV